MKISQRWVKKIAIVIRELLPNIPRLTAPYLYVEISMDCTVMWGGDPGRLGNLPILCQARDTFSRMLLVAMVPHKGECT
jgi:hypothetical protein